MSESMKVILLVEDNSDDIDLTVLALKKQPIPMRVDIVRDGVEALDYLFPAQAEAEAERALPDVVFLDLKLPKVGGLEVLERVRKENRTRFLPVVILTSSNHPPDVLKSYELGTNSYVQKPVHFGKFSDLIGRLGNYWLQVNLSTADVR